MWYFFLPIIALLALLTLWPQVDIAASAFFYTAGSGFPLAQHPFFIALHNIAVYGGWAMAAFFIIMICITALRKRPIATLDAKAWGFLFLAFAVGVGLFANVVLKDNWGRARPRDIAEFSGAAHFTPAFIMADQCRRNCSFVAGDAAFGFFLPSIAYVVPPPRRRRMFWAGMALGGLFGIDRLVMGAHFLSDVLAAMLLMLGSNAALHALAYGRAATCATWKNFFSFK